MIETASGLILRTRPLTETSVIVHWLTPQLGRVATVAKGARRPKSPFRGKLDLFFQADFSFVRSRRSELHTLREVSLGRTHAGLREDLGRLQQAAYAAALIEQTTETDAPLPGLYDLFHGFLAWVAAAPASPRTIFSFELKLLGELGLQPDLTQSRLQPGTVLIIGKLQDNDWAAVGRLKLGPAQIREICNFLDGFLIYHLERIPAGRLNALGDMSGSY